MKINNVRFLVGYLALLCLPIVSANAQNSQISWSAFAPGFDVSSSENTIVTSIVGQSLVGESAGGSDEVSGGFLANPLIGNQTTTVENGNESAELPEIFQLYQNSPNPFNPSTRIGFALSKSCTVDLTIYDVLGRRIITLIQGDRSAGEYTVEWDGRDALGNSVGSGTYLYQINAGEFEQTKKLLLLK